MWWIYNEKVCGSWAFFLTVKDLVGKLRGWKQRWIISETIEKRKKDKAPWISQTLDTIAIEAPAILSASDKLIGQGLKDRSSLVK